MKIGLWLGHSMCVGTNDLSATFTAGGSAPDFATLDAQLFARWGIDAVKHDACGGAGGNPSISDPAAIEHNYDRYMNLSR